MAYQSPSNEELYSDSSSQSEPQGQEPKEDQGEKMATIPKSLCPGMNPGDKVQLTIEKVEEDSYLVSYEKGAGDEGQEQAAPPPMDSGSGMTSMME